MLGRLPATISSTAAISNYLILHRLPQFYLHTIMYRGTGSSSSSSSSTSSFSSAHRSSASLGSGRDDLHTGGIRGRSRGRGSGSTSSASERIETLGRLLTRILRHMPTELNLDMRSDGYVKIRDILKVNMKTRSNVPLRSHSIDEIREAVRIDNKQRLGLLEEDGELWIRANQGHSVKSVESDSLLKPILSAEEIPVCVHGTYKRHLESIVASGLKRMNRLHIHFSRGLPSDGEVISGMRRDINLLIFVDTSKAMEDGMKFYKSDNEVILTEGFDGVVPAKYFQKILSWPKGQPVNFHV